MCNIFPVDHSVLGTDECRALASYETDLLYLIESKVRAYHILTSCVIYY